MYTFDIVKNENLLLCLYLKCSFITSSHVTMQHSVLNTHFNYNEIIVSTAISITIKNTTLSHTLYDYFVVTVIIIIYNFR